MRDGLVLLQAALAGEGLPAGRAGAGARVLQRVLHARVRVERRLLAGTE